MIYLQSSIIIEEEKTSSKTDNILSYLALPQIRIITRTIHIKTSINEGLGEDEGIHTIQKLQKNYEAVL